MITRTQMFVLSIIIMVLMPVMLFMLFYYTASGNWQRFRLIALPIDCAGNGAMNGAWNETISSRCGRKWPRFARFVNWLFNDPNHCKDAVDFTKSYLKEMPD